MTSNEDFFKKKKDWSVIKDCLLENYLHAYGSKILARRRPAYYVDCFAGPGKFEDGELGSPLIAMDKLIDRASVSNVPNSGFTFLLSETKYANDLKINTASYCNVFIFDKGYADFLDSIIAAFGNRNYSFFFYVDPFGTKEIKMVQFEMLSDAFRAGSVEVFLNMNTVAFLRNGCRVLKVKNAKLDELKTHDFAVNDEMIEAGGPSELHHYDEVAGGEYWQQLIRKFKNEPSYSFWELERDFTQLFCDELRKRYKFVINIPIRKDAEKSPVQYRMILMSHHHDGCALMNEIMANQLLSMPHEQPSLFDHDEELRIITDEERYEGIREAVEAVLSDNKRLSYKELLAGVINHVGITRCDVFKKACDSMCAAGIIARETDAKLKDGSDSRDWEKAFFMKL